MSKLPSVKEEADKRYNPNWGGLKGLREHSAFIDGANCIKEIAEPIIEGLELRVNTLERIEEQDILHREELESKIAEQAKEIEELKKQI